MTLLNLGKICKIAVLLCVFVFVAGGINSYAITERDFDSSKVNNIQKGVTKTSQLLEWFGEPANNPAKGDISSWQYKFSKTENCNGVQTVLSKKELWITIVDSVAVDYTFTQEPEKPGCSSNK